MTNNTKISIRFFDNREVRAVWMKKIPNGGLPFWILSLSLPIFIRTKKKLTGQLFI
jgi:hypothetical protein